MKNLFKMILLAFVVVVFYVGIFSSLAYVIVTSQAFENFTRISSKIIKKIEHEVTLSEEEVSKDVKKQ